jgi:MerR family mercuric resistance operon transcriptional regulator
MASSRKESLVKGRTISKLARDAGVGVETIRFYERCGILWQPAAPSSGWRRYSEEALSTIKYVKMGQQLGFKLSEMRALQAQAQGAQSTFCQSVRAATRDKINAVEQEIARLQRVHSELVEFLGRCSAKPAHEPCPIYRTMRVAAKSR